MIFGVIGYGHVSAMGVWRSPTALTRDESVAVRVVKKALTCQGKAEAIVTCGLSSYPAAMRELGNDDHGQVGRYLKTDRKQLSIVLLNDWRASSRFSINTQQ
ncbi:MAG: hypothetical protein EOP84_09465 [Verrucomicrobiaceae bacterium]|nr:MAG: hypothetical protein EOP84_09465 [Verrucomicrobiaceae bacterium]